jgi:hypothetical protein
VLPVLLEFNWLPLSDPDGDSKLNPSIYIPLRHKSALSLSCLE